LSAGERIATSLALKRAISETAILLRCRRLNASNRRPNKTPAALERKKKRVTAAGSHSLVQTEIYDVRRQV
jgi:hypothetical protein